MASGTIKGITIEIEGNTSGLVKSLGDVNKELSLTQKSLKTVDQALKMDPGNVETLAKKQEILNTALEQTREKLELEKQAATDAAKALEDGTITKSQYDALQAEVAKTSAEMNKLESEAEQTNKALEKTADTGRFEKLKGALDKVGKGLEVAGKVTGAVVAGATAAAGGLVKLTSSSAETADEIDKMSAKIGISKQAYQEWSYVMGQSGMDVNVLQSGMKKLSTQMLKTQNETDKSKTALGKLGISVTDSSGKLRSQEDVLYDTIRALANMDEGAERAKLANELLGKSGTELAPMLNQGAKSIEDLTQRSHDLGLIMSDEAVDAGVKLGDTMDDVKKSIQALGTRLGSSLTPIVQKFADKLLDFMPRFEKLFDKIAPSIEQFMDKMLPVLMDLVEQILPPLLDLAEALLPPLADLISAILPVIVDLLGAILPPLIDIVKSILPVLIELINIIAPILQTVCEIVSPLIQLVLDLIKPLLELIKNILKPLTDLFAGVGDTLNTILGPAIEFVSGLLSGVLGPAFEAISGIVSTVVSLVTGDWEGLSNALEGIWNGLKDFASKIWGEISGIVDSAVEGILGDVNAARDASLAAQQAALEASGALEKVEQNRRNFEKYGTAQTSKINAIESANSHAQIAQRNSGYTTVNVNIGSQKVDTVVANSYQAQAMRNGGYSY